MSLEKLAHEELAIPLNEAASFFMRLRTPRLDLAKVAEAIKAEKTDEDLKEEGRKRAVTGLAAEATREKGRRGSRLGKAVGSIAGGAGGAALGKKYIGGKAGAIAGLAAGMVAGGRAGEEVGTERDIKHNSPKFTPINKLAGKTASMRLQLAMLKMADDGTMQAPMGEQEQGAMTPPPPDQELTPANYLQAEIMGQQAQEAQEQSYYREQLKSQQQQNEQLGQQVQQMQQQLQTAQAQAQQVVQAQDEATAQAQAAADARVSAQRMRAQILDLVSKDPSMFSIEQGQPPPGQVDANGQPLAPDAGMGAPAQEGPAAASPSPQTAPGAEPPAGMPDRNASAGPPPGPNPAGVEGTTGLGTIEGQTDKTSADMSFYKMLAEGMNHRPFDVALTGNGEGKTASISPALVAGIGAGVGTLTGAAGSWAAGKGADRMQQKVQELEGAQDGSFRQALALASARKALAGGRLAQEHPATMSTLGGGLGALEGYRSLPSIMEHGQGIVDKLRNIYGR